MAHLAASHYTIINSIRDCELHKSEHSFENCPKFLHSPARLKPNHSSQIPRLQPIISHIISFTKLDQTQHLVDIDAQGSKIKRHGANESVRIDN